MRTRRSLKNQDRLYRAIGRELSQAADQKDRWKHGMMTHEEAEEALMDPDALWRDLHDEMKAFIKDRHNLDLKFHVCSLLEALSHWIKRGGFPPKEAACLAD